MHNLHKLTYIGRGPFLSFHYFLAIVVLRDARKASSDDHSIPSHSSSSSNHVHLMINGQLSDGVIDLEIGNDIRQLKNDASVVAELAQADLDSDTCSVESGFSE